METLVRLDLPPGIASNGTKYQNRNRWVAGNLVRWHDGATRPVGGWALVHDSANAEVQVIGKPRCSFSWRKNDSTGWIAVGTTGTPSKLYVYSGATLTDITPAGLANSSADGVTSTGSGMYGDGLYGGGLYGGAISSSTYVDADTWSQDNFGEILLACLTADGKLYESTPTTQATQVTNSPVNCRAVCVTPERFVFALGASGDPRNVAWSDKGNRTLWTPAAANQAGSFPLQSTGRLLAGRRMDRETLLWTDSDVWSAEFRGGNLVYAFQRRGNSCGLLGANAVAIAEGAAYWMSEGQFFVYNGAVRPIPCEVSDYVFGNLNRVQRAKVIAVPNIPFGEIWWHYPSASQTGTENDRYVALNYRLGFWMTGTLGRAAGTEAGIFTNPQLWAPDGRLYVHELGVSRAGQQAYVESGPLELGSGDRVLRIQTLLPDERILGQVQVRFYRTFYPMEAETLSSIYSLAAHTDIRETGRQFRIRVEQPVAPVVTMDSSRIKIDASAPTMDGGHTIDTDFRVGSFRVGYSVGGNR